MSGTKQQENRPGLGLGASKGEASRRGRGAPSPTAGEYGAPLPGRTSDLASTRGVEPTPDGPAPGGTGGRLAFSIELFGGEFRRWVRELERIGGCSSPVMLMGHTITRDAASGAVVHAFYSADLPFGVLMLPCRNRREQVCLPCSLMHNGDSYQIVKAGIVGGKGVPIQVNDHPRAFVTVTAPGFGPVHRISDSGLCHPQRDAPRCEHEVSRACWARHQETDPLMGSPLCAACYDYAGAVVWNASSTGLWWRYVKELGRELAALGGLPVRSGIARRGFRIAYVKVVEFQRRGSVHFHAVVRVDGPGGPTEDPPAWVTSALVAQAAVAAGPRTAMQVAEIGGGTYPVGLGGQLDAREIGGEGISAQAVASYLAKYITKDDQHGVVLPRPLLTRAGIDPVPRGQLSEHARTLMRTAFDLGAVPDLAELRTRPWAHQLGFRGNVVTKSRLYSTTYGALRAARAAHRREVAGLVEPDPDATVTEKHWRFVSAGLSPRLGEIAAGIADATAARKGPRPDWIETEPGDAA